MKEGYLDFDAYIRQGEPDKCEKASIWRTAIGLQAVDGLQTSEYLRETAIKHIEGEIDIDEARQLIQAYYQSKTQRETTDDWSVQPNLLANVAVNVAEQPTERQIIIYNTIKNNVAVNTKYLSELLNLNRKTIQRDLLVLKDKQLIQWIGSAKTGHWQVIK